MALLSCLVPGGDMICVGGLETTGDEFFPEVITGAVNYAAISGYVSSSSSSSSSSTSSSSSSSTSPTSSSTAAAVPVCPNTFGGVLMPLGATFTDAYGNTWVSVSGETLGGGIASTYFFQGSYLVAPPPMLEGWGGVYRNIQRTAGLDNQLLLRAVRNIATTKGDLRRAGLLRRGARKMTARAPVLTGKKFLCKLVFPATEERDGLAGPAGFEPATSASRILSTACLPEDRGLPLCPY